MDYVSQKAAKSKTKTTKTMDEGCGMLCNSCRRLQVLWLAKTQPCVPKTRQAAHGPGSGGAFICHMCRDRFADSSCVLFLGFATLFAPVPVPRGVHGCELTIAGRSAAVGSDVSVSGSAPRFVRIFVLSCLPPWFGCLPARQGLPSSSSCVLRSVVRPGLPVVAWSTKLFTALRVRLRL